MNRIILDASIALTWCFAEEQSPLADAVFDFLADGDAVVPQHFWLEVANGTLMAERRGRINTANVDRFAIMLADVQIATDANQERRALSEIRSLAQEHGLTIYDALYLDLALREQLPLATLYQDLIQAAGNVGALLYQLPVS